MENTQNTGGSSTPNLTASVNASKFANPLTVVSPTPSASEMAEGADVSPETNNDGSNDLAQWIALTIIGLTVFSLIMQITVNRRTLLRLNQDDSIIKERIANLEYRVEIVEKTNQYKRVA